MHIVILENFGENLFDIDMKIEQFKFLGEFPIYEMLAQTQKLTITLKNI